MKIRDVLSVVGRGGYFNIDLAAKRAGAKSNGFVAMGKPVTPGYERIVQPGVAISIMLLLDDGQVALGDCVDVIFSGAAGRDGVLRPEDHAHFLKMVLPGLLIGSDVDLFRPLAEKTDRYLWQGQPLHAALRYGISQALLHAAALANRMPMAQVIASEYGCTVATVPLPLMVGCNPYEQNELDRAILKRSDLLPHGSFTHVERDVGRDGEKLMDCARMIVRRIREIGDPDYRPIIHLDVYGTLGELFGGDLERVSAYMGRLKAAIEPHELMIETPVIMDGLDAQIEAYQELCRIATRQGHGVKIIVDEWCNTLSDVKAFVDAGAGHIVTVKTPDLGGVNNSIEAAIYAKRQGCGVYMSGSINETDQSTRVTAHMALACQPDFTSARPGPGGDVGLMLITNEMLRTIKLLEDKP